MVAGSAFEFRKIRPRVRRFRGTAQQLIHGFTKSNRLRERPAPYRLGSFVFLPPMCRHQGAECFELEYQGWMTCSDQFMRNRLLFRSEMARKADFRASPCIL